MKSVSEELRELASRLREEAGLDHRSQDAKVYALEALATRCEGLYSADQVTDVIAAVNDLLALIAESDYYNDVRMDRARDAVTRLASAKPEGMVSLEAVEEAVRDAFVHLKELSFQSDMPKDICGYDADSVAENVVTRLRGGS